MSLSANPWKLGLFVLAGSAAFFGGIAWLAIARLQTSNHVAHAYFDEALTGLEEGSPVRFRGVLIGTVAMVLGSTGNGSDFGSFTSSSGK
jgi:paraquat-inducible protein B